MSRVNFAKLHHDLKKHGAEILKSKNFKGSNKNIQHSDVSVMKHSMKVATTSLWLNRRFRINCEEKDLIRGALLHDYFLYDWHAPEHCGLRNLHGFYHPGIALKNASKEYILSDREKNIIESHMWPLTFRHIPKCREAWVVTAADKYISTVESLRLDKLKKRLKRKKR